jgi:hypothetical protein
MPSPGSLTRLELWQETRQSDPQSIWAAHYGDISLDTTETKMHCVKRLGQRLSARDFDRQVAEIQIRAAILNGFTALGIPKTVAVG